ncbi:MAG TPA: hypothetical protein VFS64_10695 [Solirubrobacterales bacterium]|nr:hypothetical protein [Solirubrobacterales bacterium]
MTNRRAKIAAGATVVGLAALGGVALGSNPGMPAATQVASTSGHSAVVTGASGAATLPSSQNVALHEKRAAIVTRASGGGGINLTEED